MASPLPCLPTSLGWALFAEVSQPSAAEELWLLRIFCNCTAISQHFSGCRDEAGFEDVLVFPHTLSFFSFSPPFTSVCLFLSCVVADICGLHSKWLQWNEVLRKKDPHLYQQNVETTTNNGSGEKAGDRKLKLARLSKGDCLTSTFCIT